MYKLGITGGIGAGKTVAAQYLSNKPNVYVFNADKESKKCLKGSLSLQHKLINIFGNEITKGGKLILSKLASVAFKDKISQQLLNGIMWPEVLLLIDKSIEEQKKNNTQCFIVDAALIFEGNLDNILDSVLLIKTTDEIRKSRAVKRKNISLTEIERRMNLQMDEQKKEELADFIIKNNKSEENLFRDLDKFYNKIIK
ncbi:MAG: dephospho-CoA kinase [Candidatus Marinimicrobia bacterium]|nr:dephospho-CoA kinase [Candidatus Neomarinimicrobiota bacterium]